MSERNKINIVGITSNSVKLLPQTFHIVSDNFNIPSDGILGKDFLKANKYIEYSTMVVSFYVCGGKNGLAKILISQEMKSSEYFTLK